MHEDQTIRLRKMCRGGGKIYALVDVPSCFAACELRIQSTLADGAEVPSKLVPYDDRSKVMVLAVLDQTQTVTISALDARGNVVCEAKREIHPKVAKLSSQVHTFLRDEGMEKIRNFDVVVSFGEYWIDITRVIIEQNGTNVVHCTATCQSSAASFERPGIQVRIIDRAGRDAALEPITVARDITTELPGTKGCVRRDVQFSARIPASLPSFVIWIQPTEPTASTPRGFLSVEPHLIQWWRDMWYAWMQPAAYDQKYTDRFQLDWEVSRATLEVQRRTQLKVRPKFSIIVPLYNTPLQYLDEMVLSVLNQSYDNLELVLVNASPQNEELADAVAAWQQRDERIVVVTLDQNLGITLNTNEGIRVATGDFLCFLDHDDVLALDALFCYAQALDEYPTTDLFYSDEDHLEEDGRHTWPYFKPDWNPDLLMGMNYVCHFLAVRKSVVDALEPPTSEFDGAQDHHMTFRVAEKARNIYHCRRVLYHWRVHPGSTASGVDEKPYAVEAGRLAVQAHLDRCGEHARAIHSERVPNRYEVIYELDDEPLVSILIPNKDAVQVLDGCLASIRTKTDYQNYEVIIIENNSTNDETFAYYERAQLEDPHVRVVYYEGDFNFAKINNFGATFACGEYLLMLNNDTAVITPHWLTRMVSLCARESTGVVGAKLLYPDNTVQHVGVMNLPEGPDHVNRFIPNDNPQEMIHLLQDVSAVTGACLLTPRSVFDEVGGLDERFEVDYNDIDFCWKVGEAGYRLVVDPSVQLYHYESISRGFHTSRQSALRFEREKGMLRLRWPKQFAYADPMGSPNFDQRSLYYRLK
ncbi:MAG: glycosyltransferase family 2 protein [Coriobacteriales bacterium]|nr:glycosyltransferase family 2 protein [Coriobacteriales bacterium]